MRRVLVPVVGFIMVVGLGLALSGALTSPQAVAGQQQTRVTAMPEENGKEPPRERSGVGGDLPVGSESPREGCFFDQGYNVCDWGPIAIKSTWLRFKAYLGQPVASFNGCQTFEYGRLCWHEGNPAEWQIQLANLGLQDLQAHGLTPQPGSDPHPAVRQWLIAQMEVGLDTVRVVGRIISPPVCSETTGQCRQWADRIRFEFPQDAVSGSQVQRAPLGLLSVHRPAAEQPHVQAAAPSTPGGSWWLVAGVGGMVLVLALVLVAVRRAGRGSASGATV